MAYKENTEIGEIAIRLIRELRAKDALEAYQMIEVLHIATGIANLEIQRETREAAKPVKIT